MSVILIVERLQLTPRLRLGPHEAQNVSVVTHSVTSVVEIERNQWIPTYECARASLFGIFWFLSINTTDVRKCVTTDAFCALVWPQPYERANKVKSKKERV
jgi:hypothetical protein